ncbi:MAG: porin [Pseudomonadota bacterium]|nr:MAG: porin [Pseudomonadota bacterium]
MNKKLIAIAVGAAMAAPMAASAAPTLYGQLQVELAQVSNDGYGDGNLAKALGGNRDYLGVPTGESGIIQDDNKRGRLGVKGTEDLGGGLKAIYKFEWQVETTQAQVNDGRRESYVGLKGNWGQVEFGQLKSAYKYYGGVKYDAFVATTLEARSNGGMSGRDSDFNRSAGRFGQHGFLERTLAYQGKFGGVSIRATYSLDERNARDGGSGDYTIGIKYGRKSWEVGVAAAHDDKVGNVGFEASGAPPTDSYDAFKVFGMWKAGGHKIVGQLESTKLGQEAAVGAGTPDLKGTYAFLGYTFTMAKHNFTLQGGLAAFDAGTVAGVKQEADTTYVALGYTYKFSKKTRAFVGYRTTSFKEDPTATYTLSNGSTTDKLEADVFSVGMRVDF